jgi:hypothetical protein
VRGGQDHTHRDHPGEAPQSLAFVGHAILGGDHRQIGRRHGGKLVQRREGVLRLHRQHHHVVVGEV